VNFWFFIGIIIILVIIASVLGNMAGYWFGKKAGPLLFERRDTWIFKKNICSVQKNFMISMEKATIFLANFFLSSAHSRHRGRHRKDAAENVYIL